MSAPGGEVAMSGSTPPYVPLSLRRDCYDQLFRALSNKEAALGSLRRYSGRDDLFQVYLSPDNAGQAAAMDALCVIETLDDTMCPMWRLLDMTRVNCLHMPILPTFRDAVRTKCAQEMSGAWAEGILWD